MVGCSRDQEHLESLRASGDPFCPPHCEMRRAEKMMSCGLGRRSIVADRRQCDDHALASRPDQGPQKLWGDQWHCASAGAAPHAHENAAWDAIVLLHAARGRPGRAKRRLDARPGSKWTSGVCSWQSSTKILNIAPGAVGHRGSEGQAGLSVEDERLRWFLMAPSGED